MNYNEFICSMVSKWFQIYGRFRRMTVHSCASLLSCYLCRLGWWVGPLKKQNAPPQNKMLGSDPILFQICSIFFIFFRGAHPHSLGVRHRRIIIDVVEESLALRNRFKLIACVQALTHTTAKLTNDCTLQSPYNYCCCKIIAITVAGIQYTRVYCSLNMFRYKITCIYILYI